MKRYSSVAGGSLRGIQGGGKALPHIWINKNMRVLYVRKIKVFINCFQQSPGIYVPNAAHLYAADLVYLSGGSVQGKARAFEGRRVSSKSRSE